MKESLLRFRHNVIDIVSIDTFKNIKGGINNNCKDVFFVRALGVNSSLENNIFDMDKLLYTRMISGGGLYKRLGALPKGLPVNEIEYYSDCYSKWIESGKHVMAARVSENNDALGKTLGKACDDTLKMLEKCGGLSTSIKKNFVVKIMYWLDYSVGDLLKNWNEKISIKIAADNVIKKHEYLFFYMLTLIGCDVILFQSKADIDSEINNLKLSSEFVLGKYENGDIPPFKAENIELKKEMENMERKEGTLKNKIKKHGIVRSGSIEKTVDGMKTAERNEKSFEELARLASSVVMISIHNETGDIIGTGSGIMIGEKGYILTNNHVASGGCFYSVRIEDDEQIYTTDELIKYNPFLDLAIIRIQRELTPIGIYSGVERLVRGQRVIAIGSPLGLFNSVSDGIISGFRSLDGVDMIQFTAPISHGSSGGAVINMFGELIGISTAGFDEGQNINLAVSYEFIGDFVRGFI